MRSSGARSAEARFLVCLLRAPINWCCPTTAPLVPTPPNDDRLRSAAPLHPPSSPPWSSVQILRRFRPRLHIGGRDFGHLAEALNELGRLRTVDFRGKPARQHRIIGFWVESFQRKAEVIGAFEGRLTLGRLRPGQRVWRKLNHDLRHTDLRACQFRLTYEREFLPPMAVSLGSL